MKKERKLTALEQGNCILYNCALRKLINDGKAIRISLASGKVYYDFNTWDILRTMHEILVRAGKQRQIHILRKENINV